MVALIDVTAKVLERLNKYVPAGDGIEEPDRLTIVRPMYRADQHKWVDDIALHQVGFSTIRSKPLSPRRDELFLEFMNAPKSTEFESFILQAKDDSYRPSLFGISFPKTLRNKVNAYSGRLPFVVVFNPLLRQNVEKRLGGLFETNDPKTRKKLRTGDYIGYESLSLTPENAITDAQRRDEKIFYPFGWDYLFFQLWCNLNYLQNPLLSPNFHGYPYQIHAAGKPVVLVVPLISLDSGLGKLADPIELISFLKSLEDWILTERVEITVKTFPQYDLGAVALAAFSSGNSLLHPLLAKITYPSEIKELYLLDPPQNIAGDVIDVALKWSKTNFSPSIIRIYTNTLYNKLNEVTSTLPRLTAQCQKSADGSRSVVVMSQNAWKVLIGSHIKADWSANLREQNHIPSKLNNPKDIGEAFLKLISGSSFHQYIPALMLADAIRRGHF